MAMFANTVPVTNLFNASNVYVVPTFQRPYAWENTQWDELIEDIRNATRKNPPYHYFAPIHVVQIADPSDDLWKKYIDNKNEDTTNLIKSNFRSGIGSINVFLVIDGQQRLITFYSLLNQYATRFVRLAGGLEIPDVILNSQSDQVAFRSLLGLANPGQPIKHPSRAQRRLGSLFDRLRKLKAHDPDFSDGASCHMFLTGNGCDILRVQLDATARLAAFMTLNDRGKALTNLEKTKSFLMEVDDNGANPKPHKINNVFGGLYQSLEAVDAYIDDDEALRQIGMGLWEGANLSGILGVPWPAISKGKNRDNRIHQIGAGLLYEEYFKQIPATISASFVHSEIVQAIDDVKASHDHLVKMFTASLAVQASPWNTPSFVTAGTCGTRDAIEDYHAVLKSLGLQTKCQVPGDC